MKHPVVVAGCGVAGAVAGLTALNHGMDVTIIEKMKKESIGNKVCGELTTQKVVTWLKNEFNISIPSYPLKGLEIRISSGHSVYVSKRLCTVDRHEMGQALVNTLMDSGAHILFETVKAPVGTHSVRGVKTNASVIDSAVTVDCTGVASVLRRKFTVQPETFGLAYKEIAVLKEPINTEYAILIFDKTIIPSGYMWCFPKDEYTVNVGAGGLTRGRENYKKKLEKALDTLGISIKTRKSPGLGVIPLGPPLPNLVYPGLLVCGDAAYHVNPLTGEGIAPAVTAGYFAGKTAVSTGGTATVDTMWQYNIDFAQTYGIKHAPLKTAQNVLVSLSDKELTYLVEHIITGDDLAHLIKGKTPGKDSPTWLNLMKSRRFLKTLKKPSLSYKAVSMFQKMKTIKHHYEKYPETPDKFPAWKKMLSMYMD
ncbi:MAG: NAD(P)/FAD-dependent oxidoreductase [Candidatus Methanofastidiosia archaeon]|jgi:geranylgeranyl reductase family protein